MTDVTAASPRVRRSYRQYQQTQETIEPRFVHVVDAAAYSGISRSVLYVLAGTHKKLFRKIGKRVLVDLSQLDKLLDSLPTAEIKAPPKKRGSS
jgi:hypothetical protein